MKKLILTSGIFALILASSQIFGCGSCYAAQININNVEIPTNDTKIVKLKITGMTCAGCSNHATKTLESINGVTKVELEYPGDIATIEYDASKTNKEELIAAIEKINYKAEVLESKIK